jgi:2'-5' RNA ligase
LSTRLFVAVNPSAEERSRLVEAARPLLESAYPIRWVVPENIHLTLKFLGDVSDERVPEIANAVDQAVLGAEAFDMSLAGFGAFPSSKRPQVVWVGVEANAVLQGLQERIESVLTELRFPRETRAFHPHLTLGRARKRSTAGQFKGLGDLLQGLKYRDAFAVGAVDLMRSRLQPGGAVYDVVHITWLET